MASHSVPYNGFSWAHVCTSRHTYRRTDHATVTRRNKRNRFQRRRLKTGPTPIDFFSFLFLVLLLDAEGGSQNAILVVVAMRPAAAAARYAAPCAVAGTWSVVMNIYAQAGLTVCIIVE